MFMGGYFNQRAFKFGFLENDLILFVMINKVKLATAKAKNNRQVNEMFERLDEMELFSLWAIRIF